MEKSEPGLGLASRLWEMEAGGFALAARRLVEELATEGRVRIRRKLFEEAYPDLSDRLGPVRGWWNPTISLAAALHFYPQVYLVVQECSLDDLLGRLGLDAATLRWALESGRVVALLGAPHTQCSEGLLRLLLEAQGSIPTVLRVTETLKALLGRVRGSTLYDTASLHERALKVYSDREARDLATRISDLAAFGMEGLAGWLLEEALQRREGLVLARAFHHLLVEPVIDSMATIASYSSADLELLEAAARQGGPAGVLLEHVALAGARAKLWVPRRVNPGILERLLGMGDIAWAHEMVEEMRRRLEALSEEDPGSVLAEAARIAREVAGAVERANRRVEASHGIGARALLSLGLLSQVPLSLLLPAESLLEAGVSTLASFAVEHLVVEAARMVALRLLDRLEEVVVVPALPLLLGV